MIIRQTRNQPVKTFTFETAVLAIGHFKLMSLYQLPHFPRNLELIQTINKKGKMVTKNLHTYGNCQIPVFSHLVNLNICTKLCLFELNWSSILRNNNGGRITLVTRSCMLSDAWSRDLKILFWGLEIKVKVTFLLSKTTLHQREPFLTKLFTINSSPLVVYKYVFMLTVILSNYQHA